MTRNDHIISPEEVDKVVQKLQKELSKNYAIVKSHNHSSCELFMLLVWKQDLKIPHLT